MSIVCVHSPFVMVVLLCRNDRLADRLNRQDDGTQFPGHIQLTIHIIEIYLSAFLYLFSHYGPCTKAKLSPNHP